MLKVVGIGPGSRDYITAAAIKAIKGAKTLVGSKRQLESFEDVDCAKILLGFGSDCKDVFTSGDGMVVLASGEPGLYGILDLVLKYVPAEFVEVIPGISSVQYMMAKLKLPMKDAVVVSLHGRDGKVAYKVKDHSTVIVLTDKNRGPIYIAKALIKSHIREVDIYVGENLSYDDEIINKYAPEELAKSKNHFGMNVVVIKKCINMTTESPMHYL